MLGYTGDEPPLKRAIRSINHSRNFLCKIIDSPLCSCDRLEDTYNYFFTCTKYTTARNDLFNEIFRIKNLNIVNTQCFTLERQFNQQH